MHSDDSLEALGYRFGGGTEDLADHQSINSHLSDGGPLRFAHFVTAPSAIRPQSWSLLVRRAVLMSAIQQTPRKRWQGPSNSTRSPGLCASSAASARVIAKSVEGVGAKFEALLA